MFCEADQAVVRWIAFHMSVNNWRRTNSTQKQGIPCLLSIVYFYVTSQRTAMFDCFYFVFRYLLYCYLLIRSDSLDAYIAFHEKGSRFMRMQIQIYLYFVGKHITIDKTTTHS